MNRCFPRWLRLSPIAALLPLFLLGGCSEQPAKTEERTDLVGELIEPAVPPDGAAPSNLVAETSAPVQTAVPPTTNAPPGPLPNLAEENGFLQVTFDYLSSFNFIMPDESSGPNQPVVPPTDQQIPEKIKALDAKAVALRGFMLPIKVESGLVTEMLIMANQSMCCFGTTPKINEWVSVKMAEKGVKPIMDEPVTIFGKLRVGEMRENGYLVGIYGMEGESLAGPLD